MLKKRIVGVVTVKNEWAVQSFGYNRYLPLGRPEFLIENLDRWGADEILVQDIDRSLRNAGPNFELATRLGKLGLRTPLIYAGGIKSVSDGIQLIQLGADRIVVDALLHKNFSVVSELSNKLGAQAIIASIPLSTKDKNLLWFDYIQKTMTPLNDEIINFINSGVISEILISDWKHEGSPNSFDQTIIDNFPLTQSSIIAFGGISNPKQIFDLLKRDAVVAVAIGNFLSYREHALQSYKKNISNLPIRLATYES